MHTISSLAARLADSLLLVGVAEADLVRLLAGATVADHSPRGLIWTEGSALRHLLYVLAGTVDVTRLRVSLKSFSQGAFLGAVHVLGGTATDTTLLAGPSGAELLYIPADAINTLADGHPFVLRRTIAMLGDTLRDVTHERLVREVEAERLIENHLRERASKDGHAACTPADLAAHLAMNVRYIRRVLKQLERAGRVVIDRRARSAYVTRARPAELPEFPVHRSLQDA